MNEKKSFFQRRKRTLIFMAVVVIIIVVVGLNLRAQREKTVKVTVEKVKRQDLTSIVSASGEIKPKKNINISAQVPGRIIKIGVEEGQEVFTKVAPEGAIEKTAVGAIHGDEVVQVFCIGEVAARLAADEELLARPVRLL